MPLATLPSWSVRIVLAFHGKDKLVTVISQTPLVRSGTNLADVWIGSTFGLLKPMASDQRVAVPLIFTITTLGTTDLETVLLELYIDAAYAVMRRLCIVPRVITAAMDIIDRINRFILVPCANRHHKPTGISPRVAQCNTNLRSVMQRLSLPTNTQCITFEGRLVLQPIERFPLSIALSHRGQMGTLSLEWLFCGFSGFSR